MLPVQGHSLLHIQLFSLQQSAPSVMSPCAELDIDAGDTSDKRHYKLQLQYYIDNFPTDIFWILTPLDIILSSTPCSNAGPCLN